MSTATTTQALVMDYLAQRRTAEFDPGEGLGSFIYTVPPDPASGISEFNSYRLEDAATQAPPPRPGPDQDNDDDEDSEVSNDPAAITAECAAALKTISWQKTVWATRLVCPMDIIQRVQGRRNAFCDELRSTYPGLHIELRYDAENLLKAQSDLANPVRRTTGTSKLDRIHLSDGAATFVLSHDNDRTRLAKARVELEDRISSLRKYAAYTHFLSLPILEKDNIEFPVRYNRFTQALDDAEFIGVDSSMSPPAGRAHITLLMLRLYTESDVQAVISVLKRVASKPSSHRILFTDDIPEELAGRSTPPNVRSDLKDRTARLRNAHLLRGGSEGSQPLVAPEAEIVDDITLPPKGLSIHLRGLYCMDEDLAEARVIYTREDRSMDEIPVTYENQRKISACHDYDEWLRLRRPAESYLNSLIEDIVSEMLQAGLIDSEELVKDRLIESDGTIRRKLHITVINAKLGPRAGPFDARPLMENAALKNFDFGTAVITGLHISRRGQASVTSQGYEPEFVLPIRPHLGM